MYCDVCLYLHICLCSSMNCVIPERGVFVFDVTVCNVSSYIAVYERVCVLHRIVTY